MSHTLPSFNALGALLSWPSLLIRTRWGLEGQLWLLTPQNSRGKPVAPKLYQVQSVLWEWPGVVGMEMSMEDTGRQEAAQRCFFNSHAWGQPWSWEMSLDPAGGRSYTALNSGPCLWNHQLTITKDKKLNLDMKKKKKGKSCFQNWSQNKTFIFFLGVCVFFLFS